VRRAPGLAVFDLTEDRAGVLAGEVQVKNASMVVAAEIRCIPGRKKNEKAKTLLQWVSRCEPEWLCEMFPDRIQRQVEYRAESASAKVRAEEVERFDGLLIRKRPVQEDDSAAKGRALAELALKERRKLRKWNHEVDQLITRLNLIESRIPDSGVAMPEKRIIEILSRAMEQFDSLKQARDLPIRELLMDGMTREEREFLAWLAPASIELSNGKTLTCNYMGKATVEATIRVNELFQVREHPMILDGREPVLIHLKEPRGKPLEDTTNLPAFWRDRYPVLRRRLFQLYKDVPWP
jgi:ATP-dependent helicase HrpB